MANAERGTRKKKTGCICSSFSVLRDWQALQRHCPEASRRIGAGFFNIPLLEYGPVEIITTHIESDFDGLASMVAAQKLYPGSTLVFPGGTQPTVQAFLARYHLPIIQSTKVHLETVTRLVLVDTHDPGRLGRLAPLMEKPNVSVHVFDHHSPENEEHLQLSAELCLMESVGATTTLLVEQLQKKTVNVTPFEATLFALGLYEETSCLLYPNTTPRDIDAAAFLLRAGADLNTVAEYTRKELTTSQIELLNAFIQSSRSYYFGRRRVLVAILAWPHYVEDLAMIVQKLAQLEHVDAILAAVAMDAKIQVIGRSRFEEIDISQIARAFGGGGHAMAAAASIKGLTLVEVENQIRTMLEQQAQSWLPARDIMTTPVKWVSKSTTVADTERLMTTYEVNALPVLDTKGGFLGIVTREIVQKALYHQFEAAPIQQIMQRECYTAKSDTPFHEIQERMIELNQRVVPILKGHKVVGIFSRTDLLRTLHEDFHIRDQDKRSGLINETEPSIRAGRNVKALMQERLPKSIHMLLQTAGAVADQLGVPAYVVGGFVRDLLLGNSNLDVDIVVESDGIQFAQKLTDELHAKMKAHARFGTASLTLPPDPTLPKDFILDVATARTEYYEYPTALPTVERSSLKKDLYRRDFTINTLAIRLNRQAGQLLDFFGGRRDLKQKTIRVLHSLSFVEDPTRVFRAIRFEQRFGFTISKETSQLIIGAVKMGIIRRLSGHRLWTEFKYILSESNPPATIRRLNDFDLLRFIHKDLRYTPKVERAMQATSDALTWHTLEFLEEPRLDWFVYGMTLLDELDPPALQQTLGRLGIPERNRTTLLALGQNKTSLLIDLSRADMKPAQLYRLLQPWSLEALLFLMAKAKSNRAKHRVAEYLSALRHITTTVRGQDLQKLGLRKGPAYRKILDRILD